jgi:integrase
MEALQERMVTAMQLRNFSPKTIAAYTWQVKAFTRIFGRSPAEMVEQGKGKKDRYTLLSLILLDQLRVYWRMWQPTTWLFPGRLPGTSLAKRTVQKVFEDAKKSRYSQACHCPHTAS